MLILVGSRIGAGGEDAQVPVWLSKDFVSRPSADAMVSANGTLRWTAMLGDGRLRHLGRLMGATFSHDGSWVACGDQSGQIKVWEAATGREIRTLPGHDRGTTALSTGPDGRTIVSGGMDQRVRLWEASSGQLLRTLEGSESFPLAVAVTSDGQYVVCAGEAVTVWDAESGSVLRTYSAAPQLMCAATSRNGKWLACGSRLGDLRVTDAARGEQAGLPMRQPGTVSCISVTDDGRRVVTGDWNGDVRIWDATTGRMVRTIEGTSKEPIYSIDMTPDGSRVIAGDGDRTARVYDAANGKLLQTRSGHSGYGVRCQSNSHHFE